MRPVIKYPGGKTQLLGAIKERLPEEYNNYYEAFIGGGAVYIELEHPKKSTINDINNQLINLYQQIKNNPEELINELEKLQKDFNNLETSKEKSEYYYSIRAKYNDKMFAEPDIKEAAFLIFLNKCGFNGLYRTNSKGLYNVPFGQKKKLNLYEEENIRDLHKKLQKTKILCGDFEEACKGARKGDFIFFDSPYYNTFDTYQKGGFSEEEHIRLFNLYDRLSKKGVYCMLTNSNEEFIKNLYKDYNVDVIEVKRMINRDGNNRKGEEVIITNYGIKKL